MRLLLSHGFFLLCGQLDREVRYLDVYDASLDEPERLDLEDVPVVVADKQVMLQGREK